MASSVVLTHQSGDSDDTSSTNSRTSSLSGYTQEERMFHFRKIHAFKTPVSVCNTVRSAPEIKEVSYDLMKLDGVKKTRSAEVKTEQCWGKVTRGIGGVGYMAVSSIGFERRQPDQMSLSVFDALAKDGLRKKHSIN